MAQTSQPEMVTLTDGSEKEASVVQRTMRKIRTLCQYNRTAAVQLVQTVRNPHHRLQKRDWETFNRLNLVNSDGKLDKDVQEIVLCAFKGVTVPRDPEVEFKPHSPVMVAVEEEQPEE